MASDDTNQIFEKLGAIQAGVDFAKNELVHAREDRGRLYTKIEDQGRRIAAIEKDFAEIKPVVDSFRQLRWKASGVVLVLVMIGAMLGALATFFAEELKALLFRVLP